MIGSWFRTLLKGKVVFSFPELSRLLGVPIERPHYYIHVTGASIDTRSIQPGDLFIALKGSGRDGHTFLEEAFRKGASGALLRREVLDSNPDRFSNPTVPFQNLLAVQDPEQALTDIAKWQRSRFDLKVIGITGSVGKTSTKEFLQYVLRQKYPVLANAGNFNNHLGLPLTLLRLTPGDRFCVAELGANHAGEIRYLADILKPTCGMITQVSPAHLEGFGSLEGIYQAKLELFESLPAGASAIFPEEDSILKDRAAALGLQCIRVGASKQADYQISKVEVKNGWVRFAVNGRRFRFPGIAGFLARNAALAIAAAETQGLNLKAIPQAWRSLSLPGGRFQEKILGEGIRIIDDGYNANPASFEKSLETLAALEARGKKILVFADMLELGSEERRYHEELGKKIAQWGFDDVAAYGERTKASIEVLRRESQNLSAEHFDSVEELAGWLKDRIHPGDVLLFKASRGMKVEEAIRLLEEKYLSHRRIEPSEEAATNV